MRGEILSFDAVTGMGLISGDDGQRYNFDRSGFPGLGVPRQGQKVDFVPSGDIATNIMGLGNEPSTPYAAGAVSTAPTPGGDIDWARLFFSFEGRLRRTHFWIGWAILFVVGLVLGLVVPFIGIILLWPHLAIGVRRLHDMNKTGWLIAIPYIGGFVLGVIGLGMVGFGALAGGQAWEDDPALMFSVMAPGMAFFGLAFLLQIAFFIWIGATPGTTGDNRYGPDPKGGVSVATFS